MSKEKQGWDMVWDYWWEGPNKSSEPESGSRIIFFTFKPKIRPKYARQALTGPVPATTVSRTKYA